MIKSKVTTTVTGAEKVRAIRAQLKLLMGSYVTIGVHDDEFYPDGTQVALVAMFNEFGTDDIPERSFIRSSIRGGESQINAWREEALNNMIDKQWTAEKALNMMGFRIQELIRNKIKSDVPPPNAASTQDRKRRLGVPQRTLMETQKLLNSVTYRVVLGGKSGG